MNYKLKRIVPKREMGWCMYWARDGLMFNISTEYKQGFFITAIGMWTAPLEEMICMKANLN